MAKFCRKKSSKKIQISNFQLNIFVCQIHFFFSSISINISIETAVIDYFNVDRKTNVIKLTLTRKLEDIEVLDVLSYNFQIRASLNRADNGYTAVIVYPPSKKVDIIPPSPQFTAQLYEGTIDKSFNLIIDSFSIVDTTYDDAIVFNLEGGDSN